MNPRYVQAAIVAAAGVFAVAWALLGPPSVATAALVVGSAAMPMAIVLAVSGLVDRNPPWMAGVGGGTIGVGIALAGHAVVFAFAYIFFLGFAKAGVEILDVLRVDPSLTAVAGSPWTMLLLIELVAVAPLTEELGKAVGASLSRPADRPSAFMAGVAAGSGFAVAENILYALGGGFLGSSWEAIVLGRMLGAAVHPLASGLVVMGWWEWRQDRDLGRLARRFLAGAGVHALWNGSIVVLGIVATAYGSAAFDGSGLVSLAYSAALGAVAGAVLWRTAVSVAVGDDRTVPFDAGDARVVAAWTVLAASFVVPVAMLVLAFPEFVGR